MKSNRNEEIVENTIEPVVEKKEPIRPKKYIITVDNLALRVGPGTDYEKLGLADAGLTLITEIKNGYGKLADGSGWVSMSYVRKAD